MWTVKPTNSHHWITVKTGDRKGAETTATVKLILKDDKFRESVEITLQDERSNGSSCFDKGVINTRQAPVLDHLDSLAEIEIWREAVGAGEHKENAADWYCELIVVKDTRDMQDYYFPVHRWLKPGSRDESCRVPLYDTSLPWTPAHSVPADGSQKIQNAMELQEQRRALLEYKRQLYQYKLDKGGMVQVAVIPEDEKFSEYYETVTGIGEAERRFKQQLEQGHDIDPSKGKKWQNMQEVKNVLYKTLDLPIPKSLTDCSLDDDRWFGAQRLVGANPVMIERCIKDIPTKMKANSSDIDSVLNELDNSSEWTVSKAIKENRLYFTDHKLLDGIKNVEGQSYVAPIALFFRTTEGLLLPVAIQLYQDSQNHPNPVFMANDGLTWKMAKLWYNLADSSMHQAVSHLGFTHLIMEGVYVAMQRNLASNHPINRLLAPHFLYLLHINELGRQMLVGDFGEDSKIEQEGVFDTAMSLGQKGLYEVLGRRLSEWKLDEHGSLREELGARHVGFESELPFYPYRDDGLLVLDAIENYVSEIVNHYYDDDSHKKLREDEELQNWGQELARPKEEKGVGMKGIPDGGRFQTNAALIKTLSSFIFTCSAQHSATNFSQYDQYGYPPNYPAYLYGEPPKHKNSQLSEADLVAALPDNLRSYKIAEITMILSQRATKKLGDWEMKYQYDPPAQEAEKKFRLALARVSEEIKHRNVDRPRYYQYHDLNPSLIPNAISI